MSTEMTLDGQPTDIGYLPTTQPGLRTLIVGAGEAGRALARDLKHVDAFGLAPIGFLDDRRDRQVVRRLPVLGPSTTCCRWQPRSVSRCWCPGYPGPAVDKGAGHGDRRVEGGSKRSSPSVVRGLERRGS